MSSTRKRRVLCIDQDGVALRIRSALLEMGGYAVVAETSLDTAKQHVRAKRVDAVVLDDNVLPAANGTRIAELFPEVPMLILLSGNPFPPRADRSGDGRVRQFSKLDGPEAFLAMVRECIAGSGRKSSEGQQ